MGLKLRCMARGSMSSSIVEARSCFAYITNSNLIQRFSDLKSLLGVETAEKLLNQQLSIVEASTGPNAHIIMFLFAHKNVERNSV